MAEYGRQDPLDPLWEAVADLGKRIRGDGRGGGGSGPRVNTGAFRNYAIAALVVLFLFTGFYQVAADEVAVVQRFGRYVRTAGPGPHFRVPFGIERITRVP
ncbi:MAG: hypothetical protein KA385_14395, partial [Vicinamibacteria bacterium]|nr:hypothetical protein [Vicinamibacteria bacterium]